MLGLFYFPAMKKALILSAALFSFVACKKDPGQSSGTNTLVYEASEYVDIQTNFSAVVNTAILNVESARPWEHILGQVLRDAKTITINDNDVEIGDVEISNINVSAIELYSGWDIDSIAATLQDAELNLAYLNPSSQWVEQKLGDLDEVNTSSNKVTFQLNSIDLGSFLQNNPDRLRFDLRFNRRPLSTLEVKYRIAIDYTYSYTTREDKD